MDMPFITKGDYLFFWSEPLAVKLYEETFYFSVTTQMTQDTIFGPAPDIFQSFTFPLFYPTSWYIILFSRLLLPPYEQFDVEWQHNDGTLAMKSQRAPRSYGDWATEVRFFDQPEVPILIGGQVDTLQLGVMNSFAAPRDRFRSNHLAVTFEGVNLEILRRYWLVVYTYVQGMVTRDHDFPRINTINSK